MCGVGGEGGGGGVELGRGGGGKDKYECMRACL